MIGHFTCCLVWINLFVADAQWEIDLSIYFVDRNILRENINYQENFTSLFVVAYDNTWYNNDNTCTFREFFLI